MAVAQLKYITEDEYLEAEELAVEKHEYLRGQIFAMAGGRPEHALISTNVAAEIRSLCRGTGCNVYSSDLRIRIQATGLNTYPDVSVVCGDLQATDQRPPAAVNPMLLVEVLSESTREYDRGEKWRHYQTIESLTDYLLIWSDRPRVEHYTRQTKDSWTYRVVDGPAEQLGIDSLGGVLPLAEVYRGVAFPDPPLLR